MGIFKEVNKQNIKLEVSLHLQRGFSEEQRKETFLDLCLIEGGSISSLTHEESEKQLINTLYDKSLMRDLALVRHGLYLKS